MVYINYFEYDLAGNRTHLHYVDSGTDDWTYYTYNIENQLTIEEKGGTATYYTYNPVGELIGKKVDGTEYTYDYTFEGQMNVFSDGATNAYYTYDSDFRRVEKKVDGVKTKYEYSDSDVVAEYDNNDALAATFNTPELDQNLTVKISDAVYHYLHDGLGSVRNLLDSDETIQNTYDYLAFGAVYGTPVETISNPFRFTSRRWDPESSLHFYRARMYEQNLGRFIGKDPIFFPNLYAYVENNPVNSWDMYGTFWTSWDTCDYWGPTVGIGGKFDWKFVKYEWLDDDPFAGEKNGGSGAGGGAKASMAYLFCVFERKQGEYWICCPEEESEKWCYHEYTQYSYVGGTDGMWTTPSISIVASLPIKIYGISGVEYEINILTIVPRGREYKRLMGEAKNKCFYGIGLQKLEPTAVKEDEYIDVPYEERAWFGFGACCPRNCKSPS